MKMLSVYGDENIEDDGMENDTSIALPAGSDAVDEQIALGMHSDEGAVTF